MQVRLAAPPDREAWDAFVAARPEADPLQAWAWGEANATAGERPLRLIATRDDSAIGGLAQLLVRSAGLGRSVVYAPHGPIWERDAPDADAVLGALVQGIRDQAKAERAIVVKVDPRAAAPPGPGDLADGLGSHGFRPARHDLQARTTRVVDLLAPRAAARGGGLIAVFGSAGERDVEKRPQMGRIAGERCRLVVVTDEDPRGEDRERILDDIAQGAERVGRRRGHDLLLIPDRRSAIEAAFEAARPNDIVLLAGKGHEHSIIGPDGPAAWDETAVAREVLAAQGHPAPA